VPSSPYGARAVRTPRPVCSNQPKCPYAALVHTNVNMWFQTHCFHALIAAWVGEFGDPYVRDTELEGGVLAVSVEHLTRMMGAAVASAALSLAGADGVAMPRGFGDHIAAICGALKAAGDMTIEKRAANTPDAQLGYLASYRALLAQLAPGGVMIAPGERAGVRVRTRGIRQHPIAAPGGDWT
jgi:hypothetical protein